MCRLLFNFVFGKLPFKYPINKGHLKAWASTKLKLTSFVFR